jgi:hypothetical protein
VTALSIPAPRNLDALCDVAVVPIDPRRHRQVEYGVLPTRLREGGAVSAL